MATGGRFARKPSRLRGATKTSVDESLFGSPARLKQMTGNRTWNITESELGAIPGTGSSSRSQKGGAQATKSPKSIRIITNNLIRTMKIPSTPDPSGATMVMNKDDYSRILSNAKVMTVEEKKTIEEAKKQEKHSRMDASMARKKEMQELELSRKRNEKPNDLERDEMEKGSELVSHAKAILEEQDDEIKGLNEIINNAKCHAIRDKQLKEKEDISKSMLEEEARLDAMMEIRRLQEIEKAEQKEQENHLQRLKGAEVIQAQIGSNEQQKLLDAEKRDQETQAMLRYLERLQQEDFDNRQKKKDKQTELMKEVAKSNEEIMRLKKQQREQMKLDDLKVMEFNKEKARREEENIAELNRIKAEKELEVARLRAQQERAKDKQAEKDALRAKRRQEEFEREARRKEKEEAENKRKTEQMLISSRRQQIKHKEHFIAVQARHDRDEFNRVTRIQLGLMEEEKRKAEEAAKMRHKHAVEVRKQVREKEEEKKANRRSFFEEGARLDLEAKERRKKLDEIKLRKLDELRAAGIPDIYCAEVSRRITAPEPGFSGH